MSCKLGNPKAEQESQRRIEKELERQRAEADRRQPQPEGWEEIAEKAHLERLPALDESSPILSRLMHG